jgi:hypothetical protein
MRQGESRLQGFAIKLLSIAVIIQFGWIFQRYFWSHEPLLQLLYPFLVACGFGILAAVPNAFKWLPPSLRIFIGVAFVGAVCDRFGLFGRAGTPGISWGDFQHFTAYTRQVNSFLPASLIPSLAVLESVIEGGLGVSMLLGLRSRAASFGSAALLSCLGSAMTLSLGFASQFPFCSPCSVLRVTPAGDDPTHRQMEFMGIAPIQVSPIPQLAE